LHDQKIRSNYRRYHAHPIDSLDASARMDEGREMRDDG
jgi:hypothetical protein